MNCGSAQTDPEADSPSRRTTDVSQWPPGSAASHVFPGLLASVLFLTEALRHEFHLGAAGLPDLTVQRLVAGRPGLIGEAWAEKIEGIAGVTRVEPRVWGCLLPEARILDRQIMSRGYDLTFDTRGGILGAMLLPALVAFLVLAWDRLTGIGPGERREIGALKAMGKSLVPIAGREAAERFRLDHHGTRILGNNEITLDLLREIAGKPPAATQP
jgi:hypothetical protein